MLVLMAEDPVDDTIDIGNGYLAVTINVKVSRVIYRPRNTITMFHNANGIQFEVIPVQRQEAPDIIGRIKINVIF